MLTIIPILEVCQPCKWCEPQGCYTASLWWGQVLLDFYTTDAKRLEPEILNRTACDVLRQLSEAMRPGTTEVLSGEEMEKYLSSIKIVHCQWYDFSAPCSLVRGTIVTIPVPDEGGSE